MIVFSENSTYILGSIEVKEKVQLLQSSMKNGNATNGVCSSCSCPVPPEATTVIPAKVNTVVEFLFYSVGPLRNLKKALLCIKWDMGSSINDVRILSKQGFAKLGHFGT